MSYHFCIHGAGGLGSVIGGYLAHSGQQVTLIGRQAHVDAINTHGLKITGLRGEFLVRDNLTAVTHPDQVTGDIDYYILLTKAKGTSTALEDARVLAEQTDCALTLQNGINKESTLQAVFGKDRVIGASIMEGATLLEPGRASNHMTVPVTAYFGELHGGFSERTMALAQAFSDAGLGAKAAEDIHHVLWEKLIQVAGSSSWSASTLSGIPALDFADGITVRQGAEHYVAISKELLQLYKVLGYTPQNFYGPVSRLVELERADFEEAVDDIIVLGEQMQAGVRGVRTSMHEDVLAGRKTEIDIILKPLIEAAAEHNVHMPTVMSAYRVIKTLDKYLK